MCNAQVILTKNRILSGIKFLLQNLEKELMGNTSVIENIRHSEVFQRGPKISKGENYGGLPYLVLDYPRRFDSLNIFAVRTMFWWGHQFSSTLHLAGDYKKELAPKIEAAYAHLCSAHYYICVNEDPWQHHFEEENYLPIAAVSKEDFILYCRRFHHLKIAARWPLQTIDGVAESLKESWERLLKIVSD